MSVVDDCIGSGDRAEKDWGRVTFALARDLVVIGGEYGGREDNDDKDGVGDPVRDMLRDNGELTEIYS